MYMLLYTHIMKTMFRPSNPKTVHKEILKLWPLAKGSVAQVRKPCNRPNCIACKKGYKHPAFIFTYRDDNKTRCMYIPSELAPILREAIQNGRRLEQHLTRLGRDLVEDYRQKRSRKEL